MPEVRLIDANAMIQNHCGACANKEFCAEESCPYYEIRRRIEAAPTIEAEPVRHVKGCSYCKGRAYSKKPLTVITRSLKRVETVFNFCPCCGRSMMKDAGTD